MRSPLLLGLLLFAGTAIASDAVTHICVCGAGGGTEQEIGCAPIGAVVVAECPSPWTVLACRVNATPRVSGQFPLPAVPHQIRPAPAVWILLWRHPDV